MSFESLLKQTAASRAALAVALPETRQEGVSTVEPSVPQPIEAVPPTSAVSAQAAKTAPPAGVKRRSKRGKP